MATMQTFVLFIHGAGAGAYAADRLLAASLQRSLGVDYEVQCPQMPDEDNASYAAWQAEIDVRIAGMKGAVALVGHSVGASVLLKYLCERQRTRQVIGLFLIAPPCYAAKLPRATIREFDGRGHQFNNDLSEVAADIRKS